MYAHPLEAAIETVLGMEMVEYGIERGFEERNGVVGGGRKIEPV